MRDRIMRKALQVEPETAKKPKGGKRKPRKRKTSR